MEAAVLSSERFDVYRAVTDKIVLAIERGAGAFVMPWHCAGAGVRRPSNAASGKAYQGINVVALWAEAVLCGYGSGTWATYRQWNALGCQVRKGQHGTTAVFYKRVEDDDGDEEGGPSGTRLFARAFRVFNADQVAGWRPPQTEVAEPAAVIEGVEAFVSRTGAYVREGGQMACYRRVEDAIDIPERSAFVGSPTSTPTEAYYSTLLHELTHWTGAGHRLAREFGERFGDDAYAVEELVAELGAAFLCADFQVSVDPRTDHAAYVASWLAILKADKRAIFTAAQKAKEAATYLQGLNAPRESR